jgi:large subunit ribosomal protein L9
MEVVLQENFPSLGYVGDKVRVKPGYARNFLIPRGIALESSSRNAKEIRHRMGIVAAKKAKLKAEAQEEAKKYEGLILEFNLRIGEKGKSFGSISLRDIEKSLADKGFKLDRRQLALTEQIKAGGDYTVDIQLHSELTVPVTVRVTVERVEKKAEKAPKERRGRRDRNEEGEEEGQAPQDQLEASAEETEQSDEPKKKGKGKKAKKDEESEMDAREDEKE